MCFATRKPIPSLLSGWLYSWRKEHRLARSFDFTFRNIDDVLSLNKFWLVHYTDTIKSGSYLDLLFEIGRKRKQRTITLPVHLIHAFLNKSGLLIYFWFFSYVLFFFFLRSCDTYGNTACTESSALDHSVS